MQNSNFILFFSTVHLGVLYGMCCIAMAALASLMGALLQVRADSQKFES